MTRARREIKLSKFWKMPLTMAAHLITKNNEQKWWNLLEKSWLKFTLRKLSNLWSSTLKKLWKLTKLRLLSPKEPTKDRAKQGFLIKSENSITYKDILKEVLNIRNSTFRSLSNLLKMKWSSKFNKESKRKITKTLWNLRKWKLRQV